MRCGPTDVGGSMATCFFLLQLWCASVAPFASPVHSLESPQDSPRAAASPLSCFVAGQVSYLESLHGCRSAGIRLRRSVTINDDNRVAIREHRGIKAIVDAWASLQNNRS